MAVSTSLDGYKEPRLGTIPDDWETVTLSEVVAFTQKPRNLQVGDYERIPFLPMELIPDNSLEPLALLTRSGVEIKSGTYFEAGDILLAKITPSFENGKQAIVADIPLPFGYATTEVFPLRPRQKDRLSPLFLFYYLKHPSVRLDIANRMEGTTGRQRVPRAVLEDYLIPLPPLPEQKRIAHVLSTIQQAIEAQDRVLNAAREFKRSLMHRLFTYGPSLDERQTEETEAGLVPKNWPITNLGDVLRATQYGLSIRADQDGTYPMLRMNNIVDGYIDMSDLKYIELDDDDFEKYRVNRGDVLFNRTNSYELVGKTGYFERDDNAVFASYLIRVVPDEKQLLPHFLSHYLNWSQTQQRLKMLATRGVSQSNISAAKLRRLPIAIPPIYEQENIILILKRTDEVVLTAERRKAALEAVFKSILRELMTGRIRVDDLESAIFGDLERKTT